MVSERRRARRAQAGGGRLLGLFDRPADPACLAALRAEPVIAGLTEPLFVHPRGWTDFFRKPVPADDKAWNITLQRLAECGLVYPAEGNAAVDAHPLVREYFAKQLRERQPEGWREGHRRLYEYLKSSVPHRPEGLAGLQPLYQAVAHGCEAGLHQEACDEVYRDRILRGTGPDGFYSTKKLGAIGADLAAIACFFEEPWKKLASGLSEPYQGWLFNEAAYRLRGLGRLAESVEPMRASLDMCFQEQDWQQAAIRASNLSELKLTLGDLAASVRDAEQSVEFADRSGDGFSRMVCRTTLADARHQSGRRADALALFRETESMQAERQPEYPLLYSTPGFRYCDLLLGDAERMAWSITLAPGFAATDKSTLVPSFDALREVERQARTIFQWRTRSIWNPAADPLLDIARDHLTLGRVALYRAILDDSSFEPAREPLTGAVDGLRASGNQVHVPHGLLTRAWLRFLEGNLAGATADLDEAWYIAERGLMKLHMADTFLHRARLFRDRAALEAAARLIKETGYHRRDEETRQRARGVGKAAG